MKKQFLSAKTLMLTTLVLFVSGCTIKHKFEQPPLVVNNYYEGGGDGFSGENNTLSTADLGVGYDITRADPYNWGSNSVNGVAVRPKVFTFLPDPDPNNTIDLGKLNRDATRRRKPLGVNVDASPEFTWEETMDFVSDASDFQNANGGHVSAGGGAMGVAFTASASFKSAQAKTTNEDKTVASKNGAYKALKMEIDFSATHLFTKQFSDAVQNLNQNPSTYDTFIYNWGTHFSRVATIGANCAYRMEFKNSVLSNKYESEESFEAGVEGSMAGISAEVSAGYNQSRMNEIKKETGAESITFVSYGGSGAGINDYPKWTEHAVENPTLIDVYLMPYDSLFTKAFFPKDGLIKQKKELMHSALLRYYDSQGKTIGKLPNKSIVYLGLPQAQTFEVTATFLRVIKGYKEDTNNPRNYGSVTHIGVYDGIGGTIQKMFVYNLNGDADNYIKKIEQGKEKGLIRGDKLELTDESFTITLQPDQLAGAFVSITGSMTLSSVSMGDKYPEKVSDEEKIPLSDFLPGETKNKFVTFKHTDPTNQGDVVEIHFKVTRIPNNVAAMTAIDTMLYIVEANNLYSFDPKRGSYKWLNREYAGTWHHVAAMTAIDKTLYIVQGDKLYPVVKPYTSYQPPIASAVTWNKVTAMTAIDKTLYIVQDGKLYSVNPQDGSHTPLNVSGTWNTTAAMTAIGKTLYIVQNIDLYYVVPPYNSYQPLSKDGAWHTTAAMTAIDKTLYIVQNGNLYSVDQAGGFLQLNEANNTWVNVVDMTAIGKTLYIIQGNRLYSVVPPYNSYEPLNK